MVKKRTNNFKPNNHISNTAVEKFAAGADDISNEDAKKIIEKKVNNKDAPRTHKALTISLNKYEYDELIKGAEDTGRSRANFIRRAIIEEAKKTETA